jgi:cytochrome c oxidase cbb3-type subunit III
MNTKFPSWLRIILLLFTGIIILELSIESEGRIALFERPIYSVIVLVYLLILITAETLIALIEKSLVNLLSEEAKNRYYAQKHSKSSKSSYKKLLAWLTKSRSIEEESEIVLDHNYDGIQELDNVLPPWWVYLFYATILFAGVYLVRFHLVKDYTQTEEFERDVAAANLAIEAYKKTAKDLVDINTVVVLTEANDLSAGKKIFESNCVACHMADGGGGIGPNLTDSYWILGGGIKNVFKTVSEGGRDGKGMVAWKTILKPAEIAQVSSYVLQFQGTTPANPKAAEGERYSE